MDSHRVQKRPHLIKTEKEDNIAMITEPSNTAEQQLFDQLFGFDSDINAPRLVVKTVNESQHFSEEDELGSRCGPWSRLWSRDGLNRPVTPSELVRQIYALEAKSLKKRLISALTCDESLDAESMVDLANPALDSLSCLGGDPEELLEKVKDLVKFRHEMSETKRELENDGSIDDMRKRSNAAVVLVSEAWVRLNDAKTMLVVAEKDNETTKLSIRRLEEKLAGEEKIAALKARCRELGEVYESLVADQRDLEKSIEEKQKAVKWIRVRGDVARARFEKAKAVLCSI